MYRREGDSRRDGEKARRVRPAASVCPSRGVPVPAPRRLFTLVDCKQQQRIQYCDGFEYVTESTTGRGPGKGEDDRTLGGYLDVHSRPPAFEAVDGQPYTVSIETEHTGDLKAPVAGYLVFPRWAATGLGIVGHVESPLLWWGDTRGAVVESARAATLNEVQRLLNEAVVARADNGDGRG